MVRSAGEGGGDFRPVRAGEVRANVLLQEQFPLPRSRLSCILIGVECLRGR